MNSRIAWLRAANVADAPAIAAIFLGARKAAMPYLPVLHTDADVLRWIESIMLPARNVLLATLRDGTPGGFAAFRDAHLDHLYVLPAMQGRGLGDRLLTAVKQANPGGCRLHVFQRNARARTFYQTRGFHLMTLRDGSQNEEQEPDALYGWHPSTGPSCPANDLPAT